MDNSLRDYSLKRQIEGAGHMLVAPSILSADFGRMAEAIQSIRTWGADLAHCDVMDGVYVPNLTFGMPMVRDLRKYSELPLDVHLMVTRPERYVRRFCEAGADIITFHPEACEGEDGASSAIEAVRECGRQVGVAINADQPVELAFPFLDKIDILLIMTVQAGFGGQRFKEECLEKVRYFDLMRRDRGLDFAIEVDGGVNISNAALVRAAGADIAVAGSAVFGAEDPAYAIKHLHI